MSNAETIASAFRLQARWCRDLASPFTADLIEAFAADLDSGGSVAALVGDWAGNPIADALSLRLAGALHAAVLSGRAPALAALYPGSCADWNMREVWPEARAFLERELGWVADFLRSPPQTNETRRSIVLLPGLLDVARHGPLHLLELGASAGLNQQLDRFRYETKTWSWGPADGPRIDTDWRGAAPAHLETQMIIASRAGCDQSPIDVHDEAAVLRLKSYVWADQPDRIERLERAVALARAYGGPIEKADAGDWARDQLGKPLREGVTVLMHSVVWMYFSAETKAAIEGAIAQAGQRADETHRVAWLRYEPNGVFSLDGPPEKFACVLSVWPEGKSFVLARSDGHVREVDYAVTEYLK